MKSINKTKSGQSTAVTWIFSILRIAIGWHFLYEGVTKVIAGNWTSAGFLDGSRWIFAPLFHSMASHPAIVSVVDFVNIWGMILVGLGLMFGLMTRWASIGAAVMLFFYFIAYPPVPGYMISVPVEGSYLWVNKTLIEFFILLVFSVIAPSFHFSIDRLYSLWKEEKARKPVPGDPDG